MEDETEGRSAESEGQRRLRESPLTAILEKYKSLPQDFPNIMPKAQDFPILTTINPTPPLA